MPPRAYPDSTVWPATTRLVHWSSWPAAFARRQMLALMVKSVAPAAGIGSLAARLESPRVS